MLSLSQNQTLNDFNLKENVLMASYQTEIASVWYSFCFKWKTMYKREDKNEQKLNAAAGELC
jgi:hypothetical protein